MSTRLKADWLITVASCALLLPCVAVAARAADAQIAQAQGAEAVTEEVIVTARRHSEELAKVPTVVTAFNSAQIEERQILQTTDLQAQVPGLTIRQTESSNNLNFVIRGQTVDAFSSTPSAVVPYYNDVQYSPGGLASFFDLESIQVLKGPQGTLFGRNATGGAVLLSTAKPNDKFEGNIDVSGGNYNYLDVKGMLNVPLVDDKLLLRAAFDLTRRDGYQDNFYNGGHPGSLHRDVGRVSLTVKPSEKITNTTVLEVQASGGTNSAPRLWSYNTCGQTGRDGSVLNCSAYSLYGPQLDQVFGPGSWAAYLAQHPHANPGGIQGALATQNSQYGFWQTSEASPLKHRDRDWVVTNTTAIDLSDDVQFKNIFGASRKHFQDLAGEVGAPFEILLTYNKLAGPPALGTNSNDEVHTSVSEEPQIQGKLLNGNLSYIVGGYYQRTKAVIFYPATYTDVSPILPPIPGITTSVTNYQQIDEAKAVYAHASYDLSSMGVAGLTFDAGIRYTWDDVTSDTLSRDRFFPAPQLNVSFSKPSWNAGLDYQATSNLMLYIQTRGSWRSGGINTIAGNNLFPASLGGSLFFPETTHDVEVGAKYSGEIDGHQAHVFVAAYNQWIENVQRAQTIQVAGAGPRLVTLNIPASRVRGLELDTAIRATDWLQLGLTGAFTDAKFTSNRAVVFGSPYTFGPVGDTPKWSGTVFAQVSFPTPESLGALSLRADVYGQTAFYFSNTEISHTPNTRLPGYSTTNVRLDLRDALGHQGLVVSGFARNLFNKGYYTGGFALGDLLGVNSANVGEPRMFGAEVKYSF